jgi:hypothetical protein
MAKEGRSFQLSAPTRNVFWSSAVIAGAGVILTLIPGPPWLGYAWLLIVAGYLTLVAGVTMKGL